MERPWELILKDIQIDVKIQVPSLDLLAKTK